MKNEIKTLEAEVERLHTENTKILREKADLFHKLNTLKEHYAGSSDRLEQRDMRIEELELENARLKRRIEESEARK